MSSKKNFFSAFMALSMLLLLTLSNYAQADGRPYLGVYLRDHESRDPGDTNYGAAVETVVKDSPADKAGLKEGDIIIKLNRKTVRDADDVTEDLRKLKAGDTVQLEVVRGNKNITLTAVLGEKPEKEIVKKVNKNCFKLQLSTPYLGVETQDLNQDLAEYFNVKENEGVLVTKVLENSPAEKAGLKAGDVITEFDGKKISDSDDLIRAVRKAEDKKVSLTFIRKGRQEKTTVQLSDKSGIFLFDDDERRGCFYFRLPEKPLSIEWDELVEELKEKTDRLKKEVPGEIELKVRTFGKEDIDSLKAEIEKLKQEMKTLKDQLKKEKSK